MSLMHITNNLVSQQFCDSIHIPPTLNLGDHNHYLTQAEMAFTFQILALYQQYSINGYTKAMIDDMYANGRHFVHDHSAFRMFHGGAADIIKQWDAILDSGDSDAEKIHNLNPLLQEEPSIYKKLIILHHLGYHPVQILDLREKLNITSLLFVHQGDAPNQILPQNIPSIFVSFIPAEREINETPHIIRHYIEQEKDILTANDWHHLELLHQGEKIPLDMARLTLEHLAQSQQRLWPLLTSAEYDSIIVSEEERGKSLNVAAEVMVVGYLLNHGTHREQDLTDEPHNPEQALNAMHRMEDIIGKDNLNPVSIKQGDDKNIGNRDLQWNTKSFMSPLVLSDGQIREVSHGFIEGAGWKPKRDAQGNPLIDTDTGQVILDGSFDAGRTGQVFAKQKVDKLLTPPIRKV